MEADKGFPDRVTFTRLPPPRFGEPAVTSVVPTNALSVPGIPRIAETSGDS